MIFSYSTPLKMYENVKKQPHKVTKKPILSLSLVWICTITESSKLNGICSVDIT